MGASPNLLTESLNQLPGGGVTAQSATYLEPTLCMIIVKRLREIQKRFGYLPDSQLKELAKLLEVPLYRIEEVASFFASFRQERDRPAVIEVRVCRDVSCHHAGAWKLHDPQKPGNGLDALCHDAQIRATLLETAPKWTEQARRAEGGKRIELATPGPDQCRVAVEGVSCLGRCDRAPVVWIERLPMPGKHHAWTFVRRSTETIVQFQDRIGQTIRSIAGGETPTPDTDATYETNTNTDVSYTFPMIPQVQRTLSLIEIDLPEVPRGARWEIDPYATGSYPRDYRAVKKVAQWIKRQIGGVIPEAPPGKSGDKLKEFAKESHPFLWELGESKLFGMGGAGEPTYDKWVKLWQARIGRNHDRAEGGGEGEEGVSKKGDLPPRLPQNKYIVCNGDESEPGTFKDRELLLRMPHLVVEGVILAGLLTGATAGYIYIRHEYHEQIHAIEEEIDQARRLGACGPDIFDSGVGFRVEVFESPGGYICGEQSALIEAMEDKRGQPRQRPPELQTNGLWDQPTVVNNVETLAWVPYVVLNGGAKYAATGWRPADAWPGAPTFAGRRLFSVSGDIRRPGVFEVPVGIPFGELLEDKRYCGGVKGELFAVAPSGPSSGLIPAFLPVKVPAEDKYEEWLTGVLGKFRSPAEKAAMGRIAGTHLQPGATKLDIRLIPLDLNFFRGLGGALRLKMGLGLGAAIVVYAAGTDPLDEAVNFTRFFRNESCGKCVPCRLGSQKLYQIGLDLISERAAGRAAEVVDDVLADVRVLSEALGQTSICGLGHVAPVPLASVLEYFPGSVNTRPVPPARPPGTGPKPAPRPHSGS